jgi:hypothetical protein
MDVDSILSSMNDRGVDYLLIGGMNFALQHEPVLTFDVDLWIDDSAGNRGCCAHALADLRASWGESEATWQSVTRMQDDWLARRGVFCLLTAAGPVDIFRSVTGLPEWSQCAARAVSARTPSGTFYRGLGDEDMLACQLALDESVRKLDRVRSLRDIVSRKNRHDAQ